MHPEATFTEQKIWPSRVGDVCDTSSRWLSFVWWHGQSVVLVARWDLTVPVAGRSVLHTLCSNVVPRTSHAPLGVCTRAYSDVHKHLLVFFLAGSDMLHLACQYMHI